MTISRFKTKPWRSAAYLRTVRGEPCLACGSPLDVQAHHLRHAEQRGFSRKTADNWAVPLCVMCHMNCHTVGREADWWVAHTKKDPIEWASRFYEKFQESKQSQEK